MKLLRFKNSKDGCHNFRPVKSKAHAIKLYKTIERKEKDNVSDPVYINDYSKESI